MSNAIEIRVPDIGDFDEVEVVEVLVAAGQTVALEDSLVTLESDKASMEIPSPRAGTVQKLEVQVGDRVSEGSLLLVLDAAEDAVAAEDAEAATPGTAPDASGRSDAEEDEAAPVDRAEPAGESDLDLDEQEEEDEASAEPQRTAAERAKLPVPDRLPGEPAPSEPPITRSPAPGPGSHASPLVHGLAREYGVDLTATRGTGPHGRVLVEDVKRHVREALSSGSGGEAGRGIPEIPEVDFSRFGEVETRKLGRIRRVSARNLTRSWLNLPHVTQHEDADITELEAFRRARSDEASARGVRLSPLHFVMKAVVGALRVFPDFRSSLASDGEHLLVKHYYHLGIAVDTEGGLVVPVVRDVDRKGVYELAEEVAGLAEKARNGKLAPDDIQGACFTISSLGGIGGTAFTPIVNAPEVAILGVSRTETRPVWTDGGGGAEGRFVPRKVVPLSLSYDHRVIDGAEAARFVVHLRRTLSHPANLLL